MFRWNPGVTNKSLSQPVSSTLRSSVKASKRQSLAADLLASLVVALMALPLCMGIAIASGVPVEKGIITGIVGGCIIGLISGSPLQICGPAAGLTVLVYEIVSNLGLPGLAVILVTAGLLQLCMGFAGIAQIFRAVSPAVINGMMSGIGITLALSQIYIVGSLHPKAHALQNIEHFPELVANIMAPSGTACVSIDIAAFTIIILMAWQRLARGKWAGIPAPLVAVLAATITSCVFKLPVKHIPLPENIFSGVQLLNFSSVAHMDPWVIARFAVVMAIIASAETLLSAASVDKLHHGPRTKYDRELIAQGIGNTICGLIGTLPMTGVIARSSLNVMAGAKTRASAVMHGVWLLGAAVLIPGILRMVPVSALAALLLYTGLKLININAIRKLWNFGPRLVGIYAVTTIAIVTTDLLVGVALGVFLSILKLVYTMTRLKVSIDRLENKSILHLRGAATFLSLPRLADALDSVPANTELHVCMDELDYVDHACLELIMDWEKQHESTGGTLVMDWGELHAMFKSKRRVRHIRTALSAGASPVHGHSSLARESAAV